MALPVDRAQSNAMNLQVLKRQDESVMDIVDMASHVVVYEFDQTVQSWKRKDVEGCLFVVKRYASPRFQIFVNNRLSTTNMTIPVDSRLEVDSVDTFLILRSPDASAVGGYAIYGLWFFPEEDREKILKLLQRMVRTNEPVAPETPTSKPSSVKEEPQPQEQPQPQPEQTQPQPTAEPAQPQKQPRQRGQRGQNSGQRGGRGRNKRGNGGGGGDSNANSKPTTPTAILQRPPQGESGEATVAQDQPAAANGVNATGYTPISREEGIAAGNAILGMLGGGGNAAPQALQSQQPPSQPQEPQPQPQQPQSRSRTSSAVSNGQPPAAAVSKEQLKQTLIALLDEPQFFDQIYHAYVGRVHHARP